MDQQWYQEFVSDENLSREMLFDLLTAANYMGIKPLLDLTCLKVTFQLTGKNAEEVRNVLLACRAYFCVFPSGFFELIGRLSFVY